MRDDAVLAGRYRLEFLLGRGGMAEVYAAHDDVLDRAVAVKLLLPRFHDDTAFVARFRDEARHAAALNHPNIVAVYDTGEHDGLPFIVMELVRGRSLEQAVAAGGLTEQRALEVCADACAALQYAHDRGLVHRDVKPGNILLADDGTVKVTDFGIARAITSETVTRTAAILGTAAYLSPEQAQGRTADPRSDVYALGVVLYETLTGHPPFRGDSAVTVAYQHVQERPRPPRDVDPSISASAEAITMRALAKNPANRYATAATMRDDLLRARARESVSAPAVLRDTETAVLAPNRGTPAPPKPTRTEAQERRRRGFGYVLLAIVTVVAAAGAVVLVVGMLTDEGPAEVAVPDVRGRTPDEAQLILDQVGLVARFVASVPSDTVETGRIAEQDPDPSSSVEQGTEVRLAPSSGREQVVVPDLTRTTESDALAQLRELGLVPTQGGPVFSDDIEEGRVVRTDPAAGEQVDVGSTVRVVISAGTEQVRVPPVTGLVESEALTSLVDAGFDPLTIREYHASVEEGRVIRQEPPAGEERERGATVTIVVSDGPEPSDPGPQPPPETTPPSTGTGTGTGTDGAP